LNTVIFDTPAAAALGEQLDGHLAHGAPRFELLALAQAQRLGHRFNVPDISIDSI
jgi:hypothetical protein